MNIHLTNLQNFRDIDFSALQVKEGQLLPDTHRAFFRKDEIINIVRQSMANLKDIFTSLSIEDRSLVKQIQGEISLLDELSTITTAIKTMNKRGPVTQQNKEVFEKLRDEAKSTACLQITLKFFFLSELAHIHQFALFCDSLIPCIKSEPIPKQLFIINILHELARLSGLYIETAESILWSFSRLPDIEEVDKLILCWQISEFLTEKSISPENTPIVFLKLMEFVQKNGRFLTKDELSWLSKQITLRPVLFWFYLDNLLTRESKKTKLMLDMMTILTKDFSLSRVSYLGGLEEKLAHFSSLTIFSDAEKIDVCIAIYQMTCALVNCYNKLSIIGCFLKFILKNNRFLTTEEQTWFIGLPHSSQIKALLFLCNTLPSSSISPFIASLKETSDKETAFWLLSVLEKSPGWEECSSILKSTTIDEIFESDFIKIFKILKNIDLKERSLKLEIAIELNKVANARESECAVPSDLLLGILKALQHIPFVFTDDERDSLKQIVDIEHFLKTCISIPRDQVNLLAIIYIESQSTLDSDDDIFTAISRRMDTEGIVISGAKGGSGGM